MPSLRRRRDRCMPIAPLDSGSLAFGNGGVRPAKDRPMNDLTPIEMDELKRLEESESESESESKPHRSVGRVGWVVLLVIAVGLAWYLLRGSTAPAAAPPMPVGTVAAPLQRGATQWDAFI